MKKAMIAVIMVLVVAGVISSRSEEKDSRSDLLYADDSRTAGIGNSIYEDYNYNDSCFYTLDDYYDEPEIRPSCGGSR